MKKTVKAGVLTGLILAPAAVVSANETGVVNDGMQTEPIVVADTGAVAAPYNAVAALNIEKERIEELFALDGKTTISNFNTYQDLVDRLFPPSGATSNENKLLTAKLTFLKELQDLKSRAASLTNEINLLKPTHPQLFTTVPKLVDERAAITQAFEQIRKKLDDVAEDKTLTYSTVGNVGDYPFITDFVSDALETVDSYLKSIEGFEGEFLTNAPTLDTYKQDIVKANAFVYGGKFKTTNTSGDTVEIEVLSYVNKVAGSDNLEDENEAKDFITLLNEVNQFYNEKMTANEKKIADSHVLPAPDSRTVAAVMKQANDDLTKANKVTELITGIQSLSANDYKSKVGKVVSEYEKLNPRAQMLVLEYEAKVENLYKDGLDFIELVDALKPNATDEYRTAVDAAEIAYKALDAIKVQPILTSYMERIGNHKKDIAKAIDIEDLIDGVTTAEDIEIARTAYNALTSTQKKIVNNYKDLQALEKSGKTTLKLSDQIDAVAIENKKAFATKVEKLKESYDKLSDDEQDLMKKSSPSSFSRLTYLTPFAKATGSFYSLKPKASTYENDVRALVNTLDSSSGTELNTAYNNASTSSEDQELLQKLRDELFISVKKLESQLNNADGVMDLISEANDNKNFTNNNEQLIAIQDARKAYNDLPKEEQKLVTNLKMLTELEKTIKQPLAAMKAIEAANPENTAKFPSTAKSAVSAYDKLTTTQKSYLSEDDTNRIADFKTYLAFVEQVKALKPSAAGFQEAHAAANTRYGQLKDGASTEWKSTLATEMAKAIETYGPTLNEYGKSITGGAAVQAMIGQLGEKYGQDFLNELIKIDAAYAALSSDAKKQVTNYKQFQEMKKDGTVALKVVDLINDDTIKNINVMDSGYVKKVQSAIKAYDKLTSRQKSYVYNSVYLENNLGIYEFVEAVNNLKPSAKTYIEDVANVRQMYNRLTPANQKKLEPILYKIEGAETGLVTVNEVMDLIDAARPGVENYVQKLTEAREAYDKLARINSGYQKLVLNYKTLTEREKALKPITTTIYQIKELEEIVVRPVIDSNEFIKKYNDTMKSYEKIPYESRELVYNRNELLVTLYPVAKTTEAIANIKPSSKTFTEDVKKARDWYNSLSPADQARVHNYNNLVAFESMVSDGSVVDDLIRQIPSTPPTQYMQAIKDARAAYDALTADEKRAVTLYKELQNYEKGVKNVQATIDAIDNLQYASNLVSAYDKATKALDKLTADQRQMVPNMDKLRSVGPAIDVYKMIESLKPSNANYAGTIQAAYSAYNMLSSAEKQYVTNFAALQEAKNNADSVQAVISKIASISPTSRNYTEQVAEALAMYNSLPSAVRKLVTNYDVLKSSQKEAETVSKVRQLISEINPNASGFEAKVKSARSAYDKLTTEQKRLVSNYFLLEDYEAELNDSSFFF